MGYKCLMTLRTLLNFKLSVFLDITIINIIQVNLILQLYSLYMVSYNFGYRGWWQYTLPPPTSVSMLNHFVNSIYFELSECEDVSFLNIIKVKISCIICGMYGL